jgi:hypothetical protein
MKRGIFGNYAHRSVKNARHEHIRNVLDQLSGCWDAFVAETEPYFAILHVVIKGEQPGLALGANDIARLADLRASLDVDVYASAE